MTDFHARICFVSCFAFFSRKSILFFGNLLFFE